MASVQAWGGRIKALHGAYSGCLSHDMSQRLCRTIEGRWVGGVCSGLAGYFAVRPLWLRLTFLLWALASIAGAITYLALWLVLPEESARHRPLDQRMQANVTDMRAQVERWYRDLGDALGAKASPEADQIQRTRVFGVAALALGAMLLIDRLHLLGPFSLRQLEPLALILLGIVFVKRALQCAGEES
jgi:phage shock protein PspC (stress-responsive transcriptional regulator)